MTRILVLGGSGMLGHKMFEVLKSAYPETHCTLSSPVLPGHLEATGLFDPDSTILGVDATEFHFLQSRLEEMAPDWIVNCIGVIKQRDQAQDPFSCVAINSYLPHFLTKASAGWGGRVIHFSTDCVFDGRDGNYLETSPSNAEDLYGKSKFLGEVSTGNALTLRTSIIGHELANFASLLEWFLGQEGQAVSGYTKVMYSGVTTNHLARIVRDLVAGETKLRGLYQVVGDPISKFDLLGLVRDAYGLNIRLEKNSVVVSDRTMDGTKFVEATGWKTPPWSELVADLADEYPRYRKWRN